MVQEERLQKVCNDFSKLNNEQQDYILGILQALVFAKSTSEQPKPENQLFSGKSKQADF